MHTDDHILEACIAADKPLPAIASALGMTLITLVQWMDRHADLLAMAKRAVESHLQFLSLHAEATAIADLTAISSATPNEERKRKSASQLLRHLAKRLTQPSQSRKKPATREHGEHLSEDDGEGKPGTSPIGARRRESHESGQASPRTSTPLEGHPQSTSSSLLPSSRARPHALEATESALS